VGNIRALAGTYKTVSVIDTAIAAIDAPYAKSWAENSEYTYADDDHNGAEVWHFTAWYNIDFTGFHGPLEPNTNPRQTT